VEFLVVGDNLVLRVLGLNYEFPHDPYSYCTTKNIVVGDCGYKWKDAVKKDHWYDILLHVKWSTDPNVGFMEMWVDGTKVSPNVLGKDHTFSTLGIDAYS
jgi:hypothetical protein